MKIIDAHFHYSKISAFYKAAELCGADYSKAGLLKEAGEHQVIGGVCMGLTETTGGGFPDLQAETPMGFDIDDMPKNFYFSAGVNPEKLTDKHLADLEDMLRRPDCAGIKLYAGYYKYYVTDKIYEPVYELAVKYDLPVSIHSGDTYSDSGLLKYSHPLAVDELACTHTDMKIVICHLGNPWVMDTAEIVYKNENVYSDLSGLLVGDHQRFGWFCGQELFLNMFRTALIFANRFDKFLYGSDWPLASMKDYIHMIKLIVPEEHHQKVFYDNALKVFTKINI